MPSIALPVSLRGQLLSGIRAPVAVFSPADLFAAGSQGIWLDPSDLSTMFSDRAGTIPITTPGTVVGLRLDKSKGLTLGAELVANGDFSGGSTGWAAGGNATISAVSGRLRVQRTDTTNFPRATFSISGLTVGRSYLLTGQIFANGIACKIDLGSSNFVPFSSVDRDLRVYIPATGTTAAVEVVFNGGAGAIGAFIEADNISVRELPGNHAVAPTDAARPIYGVEPKGGRRNLLTYSEQLDDAAWAKAQAAVTANAGTAPDGTMSADRAVSSSGAGIRVVGQTFSLPATSHVISVWVKAAAAGNRKFRLVANQSLVLGVGTASAVFEATDTWQRVSFAATGGSGYWGVTQATSPDFDFDILIWGAQLELGSTASAYQRVTTAYDVTESGVPTCHYVQYDGSDDSMSTAAIDFTATDKMSVFAGVRKLSDAGTAHVLELGVGTQAGSFYLAAPNTVVPASYLWAPRGSNTVLASATGFSAPISNVVTGLADITGDISTVRVNGVQAATSTADQGPGPFGNYPVYIGRRNNATFPFNGRDYGIIIVGKLASAGEITDTELWLSDRTSEVDVAKSISPNIYTRAGDTILDRANSIIERRTV